MSRLVRALVALLLLPASLALADGRGVTVVNAGGETVRKIYISAAGSAAPGENRLRSFLPSGAQARIGYSTGCRVDVRLGFDSGRTEEFLDQDSCAELRITTGQGAAGAVGVTHAGPAASRQTADGKPSKPAKPGQYVPTAVVVPPWTGHSITKKFGGLD